MRTKAIRPRRVHAFVSSIFDHDLHEKRVASLADATVGALQGAQLAVGAFWTKSSARAPGVPARIGSRMTLLFRNPPPQGSSGRGSGGFR